ncbi:MAG: hypothetical protein ACHP9T_12365 [Caulobacterales bacterium]
MREMLYSEVANVCGIQNIPENPDAAVAAGQKLCELVLEPLRHAFGHVSIRSAYRSPTLNAYCHELHKQGVADAWCACNADNYAHHIWDRRDEKGFCGAVATVVIPGYLDHYERTRDWAPLAWWIRDNVEHYAQVQFFRTQAAFNIRWYEGPSDRSIGYLDPPVRILLTSAGGSDFDGDHSSAYAHIIPPRPPERLEA